MVGIWLHLPVENMLQGLCLLLLQTVHTGPIMILIYLHKIFRNPLKFCNAGA
jgi:hypothetical protein